MGDAVKQKERRRAVRQPHHVPLLITLNSGSRPGARKAAAVTVNTSSCGAFIQLAKQHDIEIGDYILLEIVDDSLDLPMSSSYNITLKAKVIRVEPKGVAVEFQTP